MKKWLTIIYIWFPFITAVWVFLVGEMAREKQMDISSFLKYMLETSSENIIYNGDFKQNVKYWNTLAPKNIKSQFCSRFVVISLFMSLWSYSRLAFS